MMRAALEHGRTLHADGTVSRTTRAVLPVGDGDHHGRLIAQDTRHGWHVVIARTDCHDGCTFDPWATVPALVAAGVLEPAVVHGQTEHYLAPHTVDGA